MITNAILGFGLDLIRNLFSLVPAVTTLPAGISAGVATVFGYLTPFNALIPLDTLAQVLVALFVFEMAFLAFKIIVFINNARKV